MIVHTHMHGRYFCFCGLALLLLVSILQVLGVASKGQPLGAHPLSYDDYIVFHKAALRKLKDTPHSRPKVLHVLCKAGLGNRMGGCLSGLVIAMLTRRVYLHTFKDYSTFFAQRATRNSSSRIKQITLEGTTVRLISGFVQKA